MEFTYNNFSYFAQYKAGESEKIFFERNLLIVKALEKNRQLDLDRVKALANIYMSHKYFKSKFPNAVYKEASTIFKTFDLSQKK
tara:strand:- start:7 stop:258 length:252 start_codon:yes stop_codon:yes gene_type:complete